MGTDMVLSRHNDLLDAVDEAYTDYGAEEDVPEVLKE
jgi:hypothetical protein